MRLSTWWPVRFYRQERTWWKSLSLAQQAQQTMRLNASLTLFLVGVVLHVTTSGAFADFARSIIPVFYAGFGGMTIVCAAVLSAWKYPPFRWYFILTSPVLITFILFVWGALAGRLGLFGAALAFLLYKYIWDTFRVYRDKRDGVG